VEGKKSKRGKIQKVNRRKTGEGEKDDRESLLPLSRSEARGKGKNVQERFIVERISEGGLFRCRQGK